MDASNQPGTSSTTAATHNKQQREATVEKSLRTAGCAGHWRSLSVVKSCTQELKQAGFDAEGTIQALKGLERDIERYCGKEGNRWGWL